MKQAGYVLISLFVGLLGVIAAFLAVVQVQVAIHGNQTFEHDAGADFALTMLALIFAVPAGILCFVLLLHRWTCKGWSPGMSD
jgi:hypothetical protein